MNNTIIYTYLISNYNKESIIIIIMLYKEIIMQLKVYKFYCKIYNHRNWQIMLTKYHYYYDNRIWFCKTILNIFINDKFQIIRKLNRILHHTIVTYKNKGNLIFCPSIKWNLSMKCEIT